MARNFALGLLLVALALIASGNRGSHAETMTVSAQVTAPSSTVAALPTCNAATQGRIFLVTDSLTPVALATVAGGGAVVVPVICNGTAYIVS